MLRAATCRLSAAGRRLLSTGGRTHLAALIERSPQLTPDLEPHELDRIEAVAEAERGYKEYPAALTQAEEGPDRQRVRLRMEALLEREGGREGKGDLAGDERSLDRRLTQRVYLLMRTADGKWGFPQLEWTPPESVRDALAEAVRRTCGEELAVHQMGNAPAGHHACADGGGSTFYWRMLHVSGGVEVGDGCDYAWLTRGELAERLEQPEMRELAELMCNA